MAENTRNRLSAGWLVAGGFLLLAVIATLAVIFFPSGDQAPGNGEEPEGNTAPIDDENTAEADEQLPPAGRPETGGGDSEVEACDLDDADADFPATAPEFSWEDHPSGVVLPVSEEHGPVVREDEFWRCTSQTPAGAAFAGASLFFSFDHGEQEAAEDSPHARELFEQNQGAETESDAIVRGFQITSSSDEEATVDYWMESSIDDTAVLSVELFLVWDEEANDWRLDFSNGRPDYTAIEDTTQYTEWK